MLWRLAGRAVTSPVAFFVAGVIDVGAFAIPALRQALLKRLGLRVQREP